MSPLFSDILYFEFVKLYSRFAKYKSYDFIARKFL